MANSIGVKAEDLGNKADRLSLISSPANIKEYEKGGSGNNAISGDEDVCRTTTEAIDSKPDAVVAAGETVDKTGCELRRSNDNDKLPRAVPDCCYDDDDDVRPMHILRYSSHRDGSIYRDIDDCWKREFCIANHNETLLEAMRFSHPTSKCMARGSMARTGLHMLQIFSLRLAKIPVEHGSVELYGYIAVRDALDSLLNYFINVSRDDPIIVKQGSFIYKPGPKRGTLLLDEVLFEYDMRIKTGKHENEDLADRWRIKLTLHGDTEP